MPLTHINTTKAILALTEKKKILLRLSEIRRVRMEKD